MQSLRFSISNSHLDSASTTAYNFPTPESSQDSFQQATAPPTTPPSQVLQYKPDYLPKSKDSVNWRKTRLASLFCSHPA
mgnify:CR=1 FL=1